MAVHCGHCNGTDCDALADRYQCSDCGKHTDMKGAPTTDGPNAETKKNLADANKTKE